jgi:PAS domain-containing protein
MLGVPSLFIVLDAIPDMILVLNAKRQIVFANKTVIDHLKLSDMNPLLGLRPGEALGCVNSTKFHAVCGTSAFCMYCGAVNAILVSNKKRQPTANECRISLNNNKSLELRVQASPLSIGDVLYIVFTIHDVSHEKRIMVLEHMFFYDISNDIIGLQFRYPY